MMCESSGKEKLAFNSVSTIGDNSERNSCFTDVHIWLAEGADKIFGLFLGTGQSF